MAFGVGPRARTTGRPGRQDLSNVIDTLDIVQQLRQDFSKRDELYQDIDDVLFGNLPIDIPEAYRKTAIEVRTPLAMHIASTVTAALSINPYTIQFRPVGFGDTYQQNATLREHFFEASWERQEEEAKRRLLRLFMYNLAVKGEGVLKTVERSKKAWASYNQDSKQLADQLQKDRSYDQHARDLLYHSKTEQMKLLYPYPIATTDVPPETFYYFKSEDGITFASEIKTVPYLDVLQRFNAGLDRNGNVFAGANLKPEEMGLARAEWDQIMGRMRSLTLVEAWKYDTCQYILIGPGQASGSSGGLGSGTLVKEIRHGYGDPILKTLRGPYFHALGITTASRLPERAGLSILFGFLALFGLLDSLYTMRANAAFITGFPSFKRNQPPTGIPGIPATAAPYGLDGRESNTDQEIEPGKVFPFDVGPVEMPKAGVEANQLIGDIRGMLELALPSIVQGAVTGDESGYALNQAAHLARLAWDPIVSNAEIALGERTGFESWIIENRIGETVYAYAEEVPQKGKRKSRGGKTISGWCGIGPDDLQGVHRYKARLDPETPSNKVIETRALAEEMQLKIITWEDAVQRNGQNPDEVERSWLLHDLKASPEIQGELKNAVFTKLATIRAKRVDQSGVNPQVGVSGPQGGMPGNPVPQPGYGMPIVPTPAGAVTGMGPLGAGLARSGVGPGPGNPPGTPVVPNPPAGQTPLPGQ